MCPACGSNEVIGQHLVEDYEYRIAYQAFYSVCGQCRSLFQTPMPAPETLSSFYPDHYHSQTNQGMLNRIRNLLRLSRLRPFLTKGSVVLDFGCGNGAFVLTAAREMPDCSFFGYEIAAQPGNIQLGERVTVIRGSLEDILQELPPCNLITMNHVIEHLPDPFTTLSRLFEKLLPSGVLEGQTPAAGSFEHRVFKKFWSGYHAPRHTVIFSPDGLNRFLRRIGFVRAESKAALNPAAIGVSLASFFKRKSPSGIRRVGIEWFFWISCATVFTPLDLLSGSPGVIDFLAYKGDTFS